MLNITKYSFKILYETKDFAIVNWQMERTMNGNPQKIDGIFQISLNDENKLTYLNSGEQFYKK